MNLEELKKQINEKEDLKTLFANSSDDFLIENMSIILIALDPLSVKEGYKIELTINEEKNVDWKYVPKSHNALKNSKIENIKSKYNYKLPSDWENFYLINLNDDVTWTKSKKEVATVFKEILKNIDAKKQQKGYWIHGKFNGGKTYASIALLNMISERGKSVAFVNLPDLISVLQNSFNSDTHHPSIELIKKTDVVVIDDIGSERPTPWFKESVLLPIIDYRSKSNKLTIFTSNKTIDRYGKILAQRSQNPEVEVDTNDKIINRIKNLIVKEVEL